MKRKILFSVLTVFIVACLAGVGLTIVKRAVSQADTPDDVIKRLEEALGDEYKKQTKTELAGTIVYADDKGNEIKYHILKTTYYEADPAEVTGLNVAALGLLFDPERANSCCEMKI